MLSRSGCSMIDDLKNYSAESERGFIGFLRDVGIALVIGVGTVAFIVLVFSLVPKG